MELSEEEFNRIYLENKVKLLRYTYSVVKDHHYCEEIVQEAFSRFFKHADAKKLTEPTPWLFVVCRNLALKLLRKNKKIVVDYVDAYSTNVHGTRCNKIYENKAFSDRLVDLSDSMSIFECSPFEGLCAREDSTDTFTAITNALAVLKPHHQKILKLRYFNNMTYAEIALAMNISEGNAGFMLHEAKKKLKKAYKGNNYVRKSEDRHERERRTVSRAAGGVQSSNKRGPGSAKVRGKGVCRRRSKSCAA